MLNATEREQAWDQEYPDDLDWEAEFTVLTDERAKELDLDDPGLWADAVYWAGMDNVLQEETYDQHLSVGVWSQDVGIDFTAGISPTGEQVLIEAFMYRARITRKETISFRDEPVCRAVIMWQPKSERTREFALELLKAKAAITDGTAPEPGEA